MEIGKSRLDKLIAGYDIIVDRGNINHKWLVKYLLEFSRDITIISGGLFLYRITGMLDSIEDNTASVIRSGYLYRKTDILEAFGWVGRHIPDSSDYDDLYINIMCYLQVLLIAINTGNTMDLYTGIGDADKYRVLYREQISLLNNNIIKGR